MGVSNKGTQKTFWVFFLKMFSNEIKSEHLCETFNTTQQDVKKYRADLKRGGMLFFALQCCVQYSAYL